MTTYYRVYTKLVDLNENRELAIFSCEMKPRGDAKLVPVDKKYYRHPALEHCVFVSRYKMQESAEAAIEAYENACRTEIRNAERRIEVNNQRLGELKVLRAELNKDNA